MAGTAQLQFAIEFNATERTRFPKSGMLATLQAIQEGHGERVVVANGASNVALPGIGTGALDITTVQVFAFIAFGVLTLVWNGGSATTLNGSEDTPAGFIIFRTSNTAIPTVSNSSGAAVEAFVMKGGL